MKKIEKTTFLYFSGYITSSLSVHLHVSIGASGRLAAVRTGDSISLSAAGGGVHCERALWLIHENVGSPKLITKVGT